MQTIPTELIEKALALTGKTMEDVEIPSNKIDQDYEFSIEKFCYYLLSKPFITTQNAVIHGAIHKFALAIHEYQEGDSEPLIELLSKI